METKVITEQQKLQFLPNANCNLCNFSYARANLLVETKNNNECYSVCLKDYVAFCNAIPVWCEAIKFAFLVLSKY